MGALAIAGYLIVTGFISILLTTCVYSAIPADDRKVIEQHQIR